MPDAPKDSPAFIRAWQDAQDGILKGPKKRARSGTIAAACDGYLKSDHYQTLAASTRQVWRRGIEAIRAAYGTGKLADLRVHHVRRDLAQFGAHASNNRLKIWRALDRWAEDTGLIEASFATGIRPRPTPKSDGFNPWTASDVKTFRRHWPIESRERLAMELMLYTGAAIGDAVKLGRQNVDGAYLSYTRAKSGTTCMIPWGLDLDWFDRGDLHACLDVHPPAMLFIVTRSGGARSAKASRQWFAKAARAAGLKGKTAHGLRKRRAAMLAEAGATQSQRQAILGHETTAQAQSYSKSADLRRIISGTEISNSPNLLEKQAEK